MSNNSFYDLAKQWLDSKGYSKKIKSAGVIADINRIFLREKLADSAKAISVSNNELKINVKTNVIASEIKMMEHEILEIADAKTLKFRVGDLDSLD